MNERTLYEKVGRRYKPIGTDFDRLYVPVGKHVLIYSPTPGRQSYRYDVTPDSAAWVAAAQIAQHAIEEAIIAASQPRPQEPTPARYTVMQLELIAKFRRDMQALGGLVPEWWQHVSAHEVAMAAVDAVRRQAETESTGG